MFDRSLQYFCYIAYSTVSVSFSLATMFSIWTWFCSDVKVLSGLTADRPGTSPPFGKSLMSDFWFSRFWTEKQSTYMVYFQTLWCTRNCSNSNGNSSIVSGGCHLEHSNLNVYFKNVNLLDTSQLMKKYLNPGYYFFTIYEKIRMLFFYLPTIFLRVFRRVIFALHRINWKNTGKSRGNITCYSDNVFYWLG